MWRHGGGDDDDLLLLLPYVHALPPKRQAAAPSVG